MIAYNPTRSRINTYAPAVNTPVNTASAYTNTAEQNVGGFLGGLGYLGEKIGLGMLSWAEGVADFIGAGFSSLIGRDDWAEDILNNDWVNYNDADEWFNPSDGWKMAGDVAQGIGNSVPSIGVTVAAGLMTGGLSMGGQLATTFLSSGLSAAGQGVKEAYKETGTLGGKEWLYGAGAGALEGGIEAFSDHALGLGTGVIKKAFGRNTAKALVREGIGKSLVKSFAGEALEEGVSEFFTPYIKRATYDAQAENASIGDIAYASLVGGISGMIMGGGHAAVTSAVDTVRGAKIAQDAAKTESTLNTARSIIDVENTTETESDAFRYVKETYEALDNSLKKTNGVVETISQKRLLGELQNANTAAAFQPMIWRQASSIVKNAEQYANILNQFFTDSQTGKNITVTADELTKGIDFSSAKAFSKSLQTALKENTALRTVTVYEIANKMSLDTEQYSQAFKNGSINQEMVTQDMLNRFVENGTEQQIKSVQDALGVEDLRTATADEVNAKLAEFVRNGGAQRVADNNAAIKSILADETIKTKNSIPKTVRMQKDGTTRYTQGGVDIAIVKNGETFRVYDYTDNVLSREMTREEAQRFVNKVRAEAEKTMFSVQNNEQNATEAQEAVATEETTETEQTDVQNKTAEIDDYAKREIKEYNKLSEPNKRAVRFTIRQAIANGVSEEETIRIARVAARSGLNIVFDKEPLFIKTSEDGTDLYADAMYRDGTVYLNRDKSENKTYTALLTHEMMHALFKEQNGRMQRKLVRDAIRNLPKAKTEEWAKQYKGVGYTAAQFMDELVAKHAEIVLGDADVWEYILSEDASKKNKVLSFFSRAAQDYSGDEVLSRSARKLLTKYRKMFNQLADRTQGSNAERFATVNINEERGYYAINEDEDILKENISNGKNAIISLIEKAEISSNPENLVIKNAMYRRDIGYIDFVWGKPGVGEKFKHGFGLSHIIAKRNAEGKNGIEIANKLVEVIAKSTAYRVQSNDFAQEHFRRIILEYKNHTAVLSKSKDDNSWLLTGWENEKAESNASEEVNDSFDATATMPTRTRHSGDDSASNNSISNQAQNVNPSATKKFSLPETDSDGNKLSAKQREYFKDSKVTDEDGNLLKVYHGTSEDFTVFDKTKGRSNMDIQGMFFSPWELDAQGYGDKVRAYYLNITNPASESAAYKALNKFKGQNGAGVKAREYLESLGYDGVNNGNEEYIAFNANQIKLADNAKPTSNDDVRYALPEIDNYAVAEQNKETKNDISKNRITANMSDAERYDILKNIEIDVEEYSGEADRIIEENKNAIDSWEFNVIKKALVKIGEYFDIYGEYKNGNYEMDVSVSRSTFSESGSKEITDPKQIAKLIPKIDVAIQNAVGIELHDNRYYFDSDTILFIEMLGGYIDGDFYIPIRFGIKQSNTGKNTLYVVIDENGIKKDRVIKVRARDKTGQHISRLSTVSISQVLQNVNSKDILRYVPDSFLDEGRKKLKYEGIADTIKHTNKKNDKKYAEYISKGDLRSAKRMVYAAAKANGYNYRAWHGTRQSFNVFSESEKGKSTSTQISKKWFFAADEDTAKSYSPYYVMKALYEKTGDEKNYNPEKLKNKGNLYELFIRMDNPLIADVSDYDYSKHLQKADALMEYSEEADKNGNDGIILYHVLDNNLDTSKRESTDYLFKSATQAKSADVITYDDDGNIIPISERFRSDRTGVEAWKNTDKRYSLPDSEIKRTANQTQKKVYTKAETQAIINSVLEDTLSDGDEYLWMRGKLSGKSNRKILQYLFEKMNTTPEGKRQGVAIKAADYIVENAFMREVFNEEAPNDEALERAKAITTLIGAYRHKIDMSSIIDEINTKYDAKAKTILAQWKVKDGTKGFSADQIKQSLAELGISIKSENEADIFFDILDQYAKARETLNYRKREISLKEYGSEEDIKALKSEIAVDIMKAFEERGDESWVSKKIQDYESRITALSENLKFEKETHRIENRIADAAKKLGEFAKRKYVAASELSNPAITAWLKQISKLEYRGNVRTKSARATAASFGDIYNIDNTNLFETKVNGEWTNTGLIVPDEQVFDAISHLKSRAESNEKLTAEDLRAIMTVIGAARHLFENYNSVVVNNRNVNLTEFAKNGVDILAKTKSPKKMIGLFSKVHDYFRMIVEPRVVLKELEHYDENGALTQAFKQITEAETKARRQFIAWMNPFDRFLEQNKGYKNRLSNYAIEINGKKMTVGQAISLYETSKREQAKDGLYNSGITFIDENGKKVSLKLTEQDIQSIKKQFTAEDEKFIGLIDNFFNNDSKNAKIAADEKILGYSNVLYDFYYPIKRDSGTIAKSITDIRAAILEIQNAYSYSFNKSVREGAQNALFIGNAWDIVSRHADQLSIYCNMAVPMQAFDRIYNKNVGDKNNVITIRDTIKSNLWDGADDYIRNLMNDIQGVGKDNSGFNKVLSAVRGQFAKFQLGANLKVILSQTASFPTAGVILDADVLAKSLKMKNGKLSRAEMDKYCDYAMVRNYTQEIVKAEGVLDKVSKVGDVLSKPIQWTDRFTIGALWNACQLQVEKDNGFKLGTEENKVEAGKLLEEVCRYTQPNYSATERSALMRSKSEFWKAFTMFTSAPLKQVSRFVEAVGEMRAALNSKDSTKIKAANKKLRKSVAAIMIANAMYCLIGMGFKWLYDKDKEKDKDGNEIGFLEDYLTDIGSTTIGMFPIINDVFGYFKDGYEISAPAYDLANDILENTKKITSLVSKAARGENVEKWEYGAALRSGVYAAGEFLGIPTRNINNTLYGLVKRFNPAVAYKYNSLFYNANYAADLKAATEKGDEDLAQTIFDMMMNEEKAGALSREATSTVKKLYNAGYNVIPKSVGDSISVTGVNEDGETVTANAKLNAKTKKLFKAEYGKATKAVESLTSDRSFERLTEEEQAKAIKTVYDIYYDRAKIASGVTDSFSNNTSLYSEFVGADKLALAIGGISYVESEKDKIGKVISGSKKKQIINILLKQNLSDEERIFILYAKGYTLKDSEYKGMSASAVKKKLLQYILKANTSQSVKALVAEKCGFDVKNGKIITATAFNS